MPRAATAMLSVASNASCMFLGIRNVARSHQSSESTQSVVTRCAQDSNDMSLEEIPTKRPALAQRRHR